ncbi:MAG: hypothetical protein J6S67_21835 [Methanobrevibacter sp.]|nr:hypothetical protein [Methanobrevibacter sp.]
MGLILAFFRRFFGGYDSKLDWLEQRGVQMVICIASVFLYELYFKGFVWWKALSIGVLVYIFWCKGHWYYFQCGTEDDAYIDEQLAKGRKPALNWIVAPVNKFFGFKERTKQYCFVGMMIRYALYSIPVSLFVGFHFTAGGMAIPFVYNACFWVDLPKCRFCKAPTNWAEWFSGLIIGYCLY